MKKLIFFLAFALCSSSFAQSYNEDGSPVDGIVVKEHIKNKKNLNHAFVCEANVLWSKTIWRMIDLREKQNERLYFPINGSTVDDRRSLVQVLIDGINSGDLQAYTPMQSNEFQDSMTLQSVMEKMGADAVDEDEENKVYDASTIKTEEIKRFLVKEVWFFDRKYSRLDVRIIGLCPIREYKDEENNATPPRMQQCFWVYFPQAEPLLSVQEAFSERNDAQRESLHDVLIKREFSSYVFKESNFYNDRAISEYAQGVAQNIEANRIQQSIFQKEHDMWEF